MRIFYLGFALTLLSACGGGADGLQHDEHAEGANPSHDHEAHPGEHEADEGRTRIAAAMADQFELAVAEAGPATINESVRVFGEVATDPARSWSVQARFPGVIRSVAVQTGDRVRAGTELARVESDESLKSYAITAPAAGVVVERMANVAEQTAGRILFRIVDPEQVWAMFRIFPGQRPDVQLGQTVRVRSAAGELLGEGVIDWIGLEADRDQSVQARVKLANSDGLLLPGMHLTGAVAIASHDVELAVRRSALQSYRGASVAYRRIGEVYQAMPLTLGRQDDEWVEVLHGLAVGDVYVTENSYLVKADIDKDSAAHEH